MTGFTAKDCERVKCNQLGERNYRSVCKALDEAKSPGWLTHCPIGRIEAYRNLIDEIANYEYKQQYVRSKGIAKMIGQNPPQNNRNGGGRRLPFSKLPEEQKNIYRIYARRDLKEIYGDGDVLLKMLPERSMTR
jgi:hypothetical protein